MSDGHTGRDTRTMTGGQAMVEALIEHGVDTVFGIPGIQLDPLYDAFHARSNQIRLVHTRHEQGSAFMAMGYAQSSERTGVFAVVPGPGLLNAMAAVSTAVACNTPVLGITGQIPSYQIGLNYGIAHELRDQLAMSRGVVEFAERADHPSEVPQLIADAFRAMHGGRKQPAIVEMAPDHFAASAPVGPIVRAPAYEPPRPDPARVRDAAARLARARCPAIFVGGGAFGAEAEVRALAERLRAPVVATMNGRGVLSDESPLSYDILSGQEIWEQVDVVLAVGTRFLSTALAWGREREVEVIRIDADPLQVMKPRRPTIALVTTAAAGIAAILEALPGGDAPARDAFLAHCEAARADMLANLGALGPLPELARALRAALPRDGILVADVTQLGSFTRFSFPVYHPRTMLGPGYQATLGYGLPAALGAKLANPDRKVVAICGDGGFMFTVQELATAVHHRIPVVTVVLDNSSYGNVRTIQAESFGGRHIGVDLTNPDFVAMARSYGMAAEEARDGAELQSALERFLAADEPALISVPIEQVPSIWHLVKRPPSQGDVTR
ncbi:MAG: hypothetical protein H6983_22920 [Ectothiorhodospiraceae bacterium]|nr:hypothetical protein [Chromatiales bacterium]MCP5157049.1 hypothetical protein [Ectothiorhodospiraceae bacterium]